MNNFFSSTLSVAVTCVSLHPGRTLVRLHGYIPFPRRRTTYTTIKSALRLDRIDITRMSNLSNIAKTGETRKNWDFSRVSAMFNARSMRIVLLGARNLTCLHHIFTNDSKQYNDTMSIRHGNKKYR